MALLRAIIGSTEGAPSCILWRARDLRIHRRLEEGRVLVRRAESFERREIHLDEFGVPRIQGSGSGLKLSSSRGDESAFTRRRSGVPQTEETHDCGYPRGDGWYRERRVKGRSSEREGSGLYQGDELFSAGRDVRRRVHRNGYFSAERNVRRRVHRNELLNAGRNVRRRVHRNGFFTGGRDDNRRSQRGQSLAEGRVLKQRPWGNQEISLFIGRVRIEGRFGIVAYHYDRITTAGGCDVCLIGSIFDPGKRATGGLTERGRGGTVLASKVLHSLFVARGRRCR